MESIRPIHTLFTAERNQRKNKSTKWPLGIPGGHFQLTSRNFQKLSNNVHFLVDIIHKVM